MGGQDSPIPESMLSTSSVCYLYTHPHSHEEGLLYSMAPSPTLWINSTLLAGHVGPLLSSPAPVSLTSYSALKLQGSQTSVLHFSPCNCMVCSLLWNSYSYFKTQLSLSPDALPGFLGWVMCPFSVAPQHIWHVSIILSKLSSLPAVEATWEMRFCFSSPDFQSLAQSLEERCWIMLWIMDFYLGISWIPCFSILHTVRKGSHDKERVRMWHVEVFIDETKWSVKMGGWEAQAWAEWYSTQQLVELNHSLYSHPSGRRDTGISPSGLWLQSLC